LICPVIQFQVAMCIVMLNKTPFETLNLVLVSNLLIIVFIL
jgi:hypothetical protein